jgi:hypothetical protein
MDPTNPTVRWSAFELHRRMEKAQTAEERSAVRRDIDRARRDPAFRERLAEIAQSGRFATGPHQAAQLGLAGASLASLPVVGSAFGPLGTGLGILGAAGLGLYGAANIGEAFQRRQEGLPWMGQAGWGAADVAFPVAGGGRQLLRRVMGPAAKAASNVTSTPFKYRPRTTGSAYQPVSDTITTPGWGPGGRISADAPVTAPRTGTAYQPVSDTIQTPGWGGTSGTTFRVPSPLGSVDRFGPRLVRPGEEILRTLPGQPAGKELPELISRGGTQVGKRLPGELQPSGVLESNLQKTMRELRAVKGRGGRQGTPTGSQRTRAQSIEQPDVSYPTDKYRMHGRPTVKARSQLDTAEAENLAARRRGQEPPYSAEDIAELRVASRSEEQVNRARIKLGAIHQRIRRTLRLPTVAARTVPPTGGVAPKAATVPVEKTPSVGKTPTGKQVDELATELENAGLKQADEAASGATAAVDEADEVVTQVKTAEEGTDVGVAGTVGALKWGGFRTAIEDMSNAELKLSGLNAISHMIVRGSEDLFKAFKTVPFKETTKGTMSQGIQRGGLLRQFLRGAPEQHGSSPAYLFGHRPRGGSPNIKELFRPLEKIGTSVKKGVTQILTGGPGAKSFRKDSLTGRSKGPAVLETWFKGQGKIVGKQAWKQEKALNVQRVKNKAEALRDKGIKTPYTAEMVAKTTEGALTPAERVIHDQAVAMSVMANRAEVLGSLLARKIGKPGRIAELRKGSDKDVLTQFTGAFESFMKEGAHKQRPQILAAINQFNDDIAGLLAAITAAEMMAIAGDPRATIGQPA